MEIRAITGGELDAWVQALDPSFLLAVPRGAVAYLGEVYAPGRVLGTFSGQRCVGTLRRRRGRGRRCAAARAVR